VADKTPSHWPITATNGAAALLNLFLPLALVRILSPEQVGRYKVFSLYVMLSPGLFLVAGLTNGLYHWVGKYPATKQEVRQSWTWLVGLGLAFCAAGMLLSGRLSTLVRIPLFDMRIFLLSSPIFLAALFLEDLLIAQGRIWTGSIYGSGFNVLRAAAILAAACWTRSVEGVLWAVLGTAAARMMAGLTLFRGSEELKPLFSLEKTANALRYAVPVSIAALAGLALQNVDQMILSFRLRPESFAFYAMGCLSVPPLQVLETSVNRVLIPRLSRAFGEGDLARAAALYSEGVSELFLFLLPATVGMIVFAQPIIQLLFTERYMAASAYLRLYALFYLLLSLPYDVAARARGDGGWILRTSLTFAPLSIAATWFSAGRWGAMGALIAFLSVQLALRLYSLGYQRRCFQAPRRRFLPLGQMLFQTAAVLALAAGAFAARPLFSGRESWFLVTGPIFTLLYFGMAYAARRRRLPEAEGPIRVLELSQTLGLGGLERMLYSLSHALHRHGRFKVLVVAYDHPLGGPSLKPLFEEAGIPLMQWEKGNGFSLRNLLRLVQVIRAEKVRVVHAHDLGPLIYGSLAKLLCPGRVRLFLTLHTLLAVQHSRRYRFYFKFFLRFPDRIIAVSPGVKAGLLALGLRPDRVEVIPNGAAFSPSSPGLLEAGEKRSLRKGLFPDLPFGLYSARWMICLARLHPGKGQDVVLDVWRALPPEARAGMLLFLVGQKTDPDYARALQRRIASLPDRERVIVAGPSDRPDTWLRAADLFISGSLHEGMPLAPLEAVGSGLPAVLSDIEGHRFLAPWAHVFDPARPEEGAGRVVEVLESLRKDGEALYFESRWRAAEPLRRKWDAPTMTSLYADIFQSKAAL
jgi:O-antigen/teichoic acid export membrane protein/glycosyltransferase involved in cell wall biosynthesis